MYQLRRKLFSQNFLYDRKLVSKLVRSSSIDKKDLVLEIGPGKGIITEALIRQAQHVLAVEIDSHLYAHLQEKLVWARNLTLYRDNILNFKLPVIPYKVFANIPFAIEGKILRYLIDAKNPPNDCYLVVMKELAYRLSAPYKENWFSLAHKPWFNFSITHQFGRSDFRPIPNVDAVLFRFNLKDNYLLRWGEKASYQKFLRTCFGQGLPVWQNMKNAYGRKLTEYLLMSLGINKNQRPSDLSLEKWIIMYRKFISSRI